MIAFKGMERIRSWFDSQTFSQYDPALILVMPVFFNSCYALFSGKAFEHPLHLTKPQHYVGIRRAVENTEKRNDLNITEIKAFRKSCPEF